MMSKEFPTFSSSPEDADDVPMPREHKKVYKPDGSGLEEVPEAGYARPSEMGPKIEIVGERKKRIGRGTIPVKQIRPEKGRVIKEWKEDDHNDYILRTPIYEDDEKEPPAP